MIFSFKVTVRGGMHASVHVLIQIRLIPEPVIKFTKKWSIRICPCVSQLRLQHFATLHVIPHSCMFIWHGKHLLSPGNRFVVAVAPWLISVSPAHTCLDGSCVCFFLLCCLNHVNVNIYGILYVHFPVHTCEMVIFSPTATCLLAQRFAAHSCHHTVDDEPWCTKFIPLRWSYTGLNPSFFPAVVPLLQV